MSSNGDFRTKREQADKRHAEKVEILNLRNEHRQDFHGRIKAELTNALQQTGDPALANPQVRPKAGTRGVMYVEIDCREGRHIEFACSVSSKATGIDAYCSPISIIAHSDGGQTARTTFRPTSEPTPSDELAPSDDLVSESQFSIDVRELAAAVASLVRDL
jgi:hypothetical protein